MRSALRRSSIVTAAGLTCGWLVAAQPTARSGDSAHPSQQQDQTRPPIFRAGANFVMVDAYPRHDGQLVEGLTADDFVVLEDDVPQAIEAFEFVEAGGVLTVEARQNPTSRTDEERDARDPRNRIFVLFLDGDHMHIEGTRRATAPGIAFLRAMSGPGDLFAVLTAEIPVTGLTFSRELDAAEAALERYWDDAFVRRATASVSDVEPRTAHERTVYECFVTRYDQPAVNEALVFRLLGLIRREQLFVRIKELAARLTGLRDARSHVVLFSGGWILREPDPDLLRHAWRDVPRPGTDPFGRLALGRRQPDEPGNKAACDSELMRLAMLDERVVFQETIDEAGRSNVSIHPVDPAGLAVFDDPGVMTRAQPVGGLPRTPYRDRLGTLRALAVATEGVATVATNDVVTPVRQLARDLSSYYLLGYYSTNSEFDGRYRRIEVRLREPDERVSARRGYLAPTGEAVRELDAAHEASAEELEARAPIGDALNALARLDAAETLFVDAVVDGDELVVLAETTPASLGRYLEEGAAAHMTAATSSGGVLGEDRHPFPAGRPAGVYRLPVSPASADGLLVTFSVQGAVGPLSRTLELAPESSSVLTARMIFRATPASRSPVWPAPSRLFRRAERVHIEWTVPGPLDARAARLLGTDGEPLPVPVALSETSADGRAVLALDLRLAALAPGDYLLEVTASGRGETRTDLVAIRVRQ